MTSISRGSKFIVADKAVADIDKMSTILVTVDEHILRAF